MLNKTIEKIYHKLFVRLYRINHNRRCYYKHNALDKTKRLVLYLNYPKFIHFGDGLWFEPIARFLAANHNLVICCNPQMELYFKHLGYEIIGKQDIVAKDVLVTRTELAFHLRSKKNVFWLYFDYIGLTKPLIDTMLESVATYLNLDLKNIDPKPQKPEFTQLEKESIAAKFKLQPTKKYAIFNNYIDSHKFGLKKSDLQKSEKALFDSAKKYKQEKNLQLIHTGTARDKSRNKNSYEIVDLDLRGITNVLDVFALAALDNVISYIGFDTFPMHVFNLYDKDSYINLRPGFTQSYNAIVKKHVAIPFSRAKAKITFL